MLFATSAVPVTLLGEETIQLSDGGPWSQVSIYSPPIISPDSAMVVYIMDGDTDGKPERAISCRDHIVYSGIIGRRPYSISNNSRKVVYVASDKVWSTDISGAICLIFKDGFESGGVTRWQ